MIDVLDVRAAYYNRGKESGDLIHCAVAHLFHGKRKVL